MMDGMGWGMMGWGWILWIIILVLIIWGIVRIATNPSSPSKAPRETALDILKKRYARGEISREEFEQMKKDLEE